MNWITILVGAVVLVAFAAILGLIKSALRLIISLVVGVLVSGLAYWAVQSLGLAETVPDAVILIPGALAALTVLIKRR
ncbi:MAG: hypothetical protein J7M39_13290 [Anaerolineae bacterium]|nr:hypothetical protein [Anaerolineae bacterium]